jgi:hypothetical protein
MYKLQVYEYCLLQYLLVVLLLYLLCAQSCHTHFAGGASWHGSASDLSVMMAANTQMST